MSDTPLRTPYAALGDERGVRQLVDRFYDLMDALPETATIRAMHPEDLAESRDKLFEFLSGWLGGPPLYAQRRGHPRLRARHLPFAVDAVARDQWLLCMNRALDEAGLDAMMSSTLKQSFFNMADHLRNQPQAPHAASGEPGGTSGN